MRRIYADHAATTPTDPRVVEAMLPFLREDFGNPSSLHEWGRQARMAIDDARDALSEALRCLPGEVLFTSSGTEAANLAIIGTALAHRGSARSRILLSSVEHHCVLECRSLLESFGYSVELIPCERDTTVSAQTVREMVDERTLLVSVMHANNETGAINDAERIGEACRAVGALYHCDAVQTFTLIAFKKPPAEWVDFVSLSAHKVYGPKGAGALFVRAGVKPSPVLVGGGQEREMRAGTENVAGIVGFAKAVRLAAQDEDRVAKTRAARDAFVGAIERAGGAVFTTPDWSRVLPGHAHLRFPGRRADAALINLDQRGVAASSGAACSSGSIEPSHVLLAAGFSDAEAQEGLRLSFGKDSTEADGVAAAHALAACLAVR
ncbi:MAG: cysteine desulfurase family protein [Armatimonadota bacterium]